MIRKAGRSDSSVNQLFGLLIPACRARLHQVSLLSHFPLPTSHFPLPTSHFPLPTSHFPLPPSD